METKQRGNWQCTEITSVFTIPRQIPSLEFLCSISQFSFIYAMISPRTPYDVLWSHGQETLLWGIVKSCEFRKGVNLCVRLSWCGIWLIDVILCGPTFFFLETEWESWPIFCSESKLHYETECVCVVCFSIMRLLQLAVHKICVATQNVSNRF